MTYPKYAAISFSLGMIIFGIITFKLNYQEFKNTRKLDSDLLDDAFDSDNFLEDVNTLEEEFKKRKSIASQKFIASIFMIFMGLLSIIAILTGRAIDVY